MDFLEGPNMKAPRGFNFQAFIKLSYANHLCNPEGIFRGYDHGTQSQLLAGWRSPQYVGGPTIFYQNFPTPPLWFQFLRR